MDVTPAPLAVTVTVAVPGAAVLVAVNVNVLVAVPLGTGVGLKEAVTPLGRPLAARSTAPVKFVRPTVTVRLPLAPCVTASVAALKLALMEDGAGFTVSAIVAVLDSTPVPLAVTVTVAAPVAAVMAAVSVNTLPVVPSGSDTGLNEAVTPVGRPVALRPTAPVKLDRSTVTVTVLFCPCVSVRVCPPKVRVMLGFGVVASHPSAKSVTSKAIALEVRGIRCMKNLRTGFG